MIEKHTIEIAQREPWQTKSGAWVGRMCRQRPPAMDRHAERLQAALLAGRGVRPLGTMARTDWDGIIIAVSVGMIVAAALLHHWTR